MASCVCELTWRYLRHGSPLAGRNRDHVWMRREDARGRQHCPAAVGMSEINDKQVAGEVRRCRNRRENRALGKAADEAGPHLLPNVLVSLWSGHVALQLDRGAKREKKWTLLDTRHTLHAWSMQTSKEGAPRAACRL
jgi:hypothetical protein